MLCIIVLQKAFPGIFQVMISNRMVWAEDKVQGEVPGSNVLTVMYASKGGTEDCCGDSPL